MGPYSNNMDHDDQNITDYKTVSMIPQVPQQYGYFFIVSHNESNEDNYCMNKFFIEK